jgi:hypothetical protein
MHVIYLIIIIYLNNIALKFMPGKLLFLAVFLIFPFSSCQDEIIIPKPCAEPNLPFTKIVLTIQSDISSGTEINVSRKDLSKRSCKPLIGAGFKTI